MTSDTYIMSRIEALEAEIAELKRKLTTRGTRPVKSLYGILGDVDFTPEEIDGVKASWEGTRRDDV